MKQGLAQKATWTHLSKGANNCDCSGVVNSEVAHSLKCVQDRTQIQLKELCNNLSHQYKLNTDIGLGTMTRTRQCDTNGGPQLIQSQLLVGWFGSYVASVCQLSSSLLMSEDGRQTSFSKCEDDLFDLQPKSYTPHGRTKGSSMKGCSVGSTFYVEATFPSVRTRFLIPIFKQILN